MRLDNEQESTNYEVQPPGRGGRGLGGGLGSMLIPLIASKFGLGGVVVAVIAVALFSGGGEMLSGPSGSSEPGATGPRPQLEDLSDVQRLSLRILGSTERVWSEVFMEHGMQYTPTVLSFYSRSGQSGCGAAQSAMGPSIARSTRRSTSTPISMTS